MLDDPLLFSAVMLNVYLNPVIRLRMVTEEVLTLVMLVGIRLVTEPSVNT